MKYATKKTYGTKVRYTDVVDVPKSKENDPVAWLTVQFPTIDPSEWSPVDDQTQNGDIILSGGAIRRRHPKRPPPPLNFAEFRKCFTQNEIIPLDNLDDNAYLTSVGINLSVAEKAEVNSILTEWRDAGDNFKINEAQVIRIKELGFLAESRVPEVSRGDRKR